MVTAWLYTLLVVAVGLERLAELAVSSRNATWSFARGGQEHGRGHYPVMVVLHTGLLIACVAEVWLAARPFVPAVGWPMLGLVLVAQAVRWSAIATLGRHWNTRVIVVPGMKRVDRGIYRYLSHPNYMAVVIEGVALPMIHTAWITALTFTALNAALLYVRIGVEERALRGATAHDRVTTPPDTVGSPRRWAAPSSPPPSPHLAMPDEAPRPSAP